MTRRNGEILTTRRDRLPMFLLLLVYATLAFRLVWVMVNSTTGLSVHLDQFAVAATSLIGVDRLRLDQQPPKSQAMYWLDQTARNRSAKENAQIAAGAALMLDSPQYGFINQHLKKLEKLDFPGIFSGWRPELDIDTIQRLGDDFESLCREECLSKIESAARIDSENVDLWRTRAILLFTNKYLSLESTPRRNDWLSVLDECARHDPDNALYDYLAAYHLWSSSADYHYENGHWALKTADQTTFDQGDLRLAAGQLKRHLTFASNGYAVTMAFLNSTSANALDRIRAAESREIINRAAMFLVSVERWQRVKVDVAKSDSNFGAAASDVRTVIRIAEQMERGGNDPGLVKLPLFFRRWSLANLKQMNDDQTNILDADEAQTILTDLDRVTLDLEVQHEVGKRWDSKIKDEDKSSRVGVAYLLMFISLQIVISTFTLALCSKIAGRVFGAASDDERLKVGWKILIVSWLFGIGGSFLLLGIFPEEFITLRGATQIRIPVTELQEILSLQDRKWIWTLIQWETRSGIVAASMLAAGFLFVWSMLRQARIREIAYRELLQKKNRSLFRRASDVVVRSCVMMHGNRI